MICKKRYLNPTNEDCRFCEFKSTCTFDLIKKSASKIENIQNENKNNLFSKVEEDKGPVGCLYQMVVGIISIIGIALLAGLLQFIFTS